MGFCWEKCSACALLGVGLGTLYLPASGHRGLVTAVLLMLEQCSRSIVGRKLVHLFLPLCVCVSPQRWGKVGSHIEHIASRFCLDTETIGDTNESIKELVINPCESTAMSQRWDMVMS